MGNEKWDKFKATIAVNLIGMGPGILYAQRNLSWANKHFTNNPALRRYFLIAGGINLLMINISANRLGQHYLKNNDLLEEKTQLGIDVFTAGKSAKSIHKIITKKGNVHGAFDDTNTIYDGVESVNIFTNSYKSKEEKHKE
jgi:hypothetical protein